MFSGHLQDILDFIKEIFESRTRVLKILFYILMGILIIRLFDLQIVRGSSYLNNFTLAIEKERTVPAARGNIYDRNGKLLAYNELAYTVSIEDNGTYDTLREKNQALNSVIYNVIQILEKHGDSLVSDFDIELNNHNEYQYKVEGTARLRFLADVFGYPKIDGLKYNKNLGCSEDEATASQIVELLSNKDHYNITEEEYPSVSDRLGILSIRYALSRNNYQKYLTTTIARQISNESYAEIMENLYNLQGVSVAQDSVRKYNSSTYLAPIIGYTGKISSEELQEFNTEDNVVYTINDVVGKAGIEKLLEANLKGTKGYEKLYVDNLGKIIQIAESDNPKAGNDVYLTIDSELQEAAYHIVEQRLAGILISKLVNEVGFKNDEETRASDLQIAISDAYFAILDNNIVDLNHFTDEEAGPNEQRINSIFEGSYENVCNDVADLLYSPSITYGQMDAQRQSYIDFIIKQLFTNGYLSFDRINTSDEMYVKWKAGEITTKDYLVYSISKGWLDVNKFDVQSAYSDSNEIYNQLCDYIKSKLFTDKEFKKLVYENLFDTGAITGQMICMTLYEQRVLSNDDPMMSSLSNGSMSAYDFLINKISTLEITPGMLGLDPCSASCVVVDPSNGETIACVSYPGYDNNRLANNVDSRYYAQLTQSKSYPLYNHATQERTAPGSTFKMVTSAAALTEGYITPFETIEDKGIFEYVSPSPRCWVYPGNHGELNVSGAITNSCNYFFYMMGYNFSLQNGNYTPDKGVEIIRKYAENFGLGETSGLEIVENDPKIADEYPVTAAIGQSNHLFNTAQLARYVMSVANNGKCYSLSLIDKINDHDGNLVEDKQANLSREVQGISSSTWQAIHSGMSGVVENLKCFDNVKTSSAGKTGTAEEAANRGNHVLYVGYAPYDNPKMAVSVRIPHGYTSGNSAAIAANVIKYYFKEDGYNSLVTGKAESDGGQNVGD